MFSRLFNMDAPFGVTMETPSVTSTGWCADHRVLLTDHHRRGRTDRAVRHRSACQRGHRRRNHPHFRCSFQSESRPVDAAVDRAVGDRRTDRSVLVFDQPVELNALKSVVSILFMPVFPFVRRFRRDCDIRKYLAQCRACCLRSSTAGVRGAGLRGRDRRRHVCRGEVVAAGSFSVAVARIADGRVRHDAADRARHRADRGPGRRPPTNRSRSGHGWLRCRSATCKFWTTDRNRFRCSTAVPDEKAGPRSVRYAVLTKEYPGR